MLMRWHKIQLNCPECKQKVLITDISASADGEILIEMICERCQAQLQMKTTGTRLSIQSLYYDMEAHEGKQPKPRQIAPPPPPKVNPKADDDFLHNFGIGGDDPRGGE